MGCVSEVPDTIILLYYYCVRVCQLFVIVKLTVFLLCTFFFNYFHFVVPLYLEKYFENVSLSSGAKGKLQKELLLFWRPDCGS